MNHEIFLVPRAGISWAQMEEALLALGATAEEPSEGYLFAWRLGKTNVRLFVDDVLSVEQLVVEGPEKDQVADRLRTQVPTYSPQDMPALFAQIEDDDDLDDCLKVLALVTRENALPEPALLELFRRGFSHDDPLIREGALVAASVPAWPELRADVQRLEMDEDDDVRTTASVVLAELDRRGSP